MGFTDILGREDTPPNIFGIEPRRIPKTKDAWEWELPTGFARMNYDGEYWVMVFIKRGEAQRGYAYSCLDRSPWGAINGLKDRLLRLDPRTYRDRDYDGDTF